MFLLKVLKQYFKKLYARYQFYKKFNILLESSCNVPSCHNIALGDNFSLGANCEIYCQDEGSKILIGNNVAINSGVIINGDCQGEIKIGDNVLIGPNVILRSSNHSFSDPHKPIRLQGHVPGKIIIEDNVWLGAGVIVLPDVTIGKGSVIGAGAVVTKNISPYSIAVGDGVVAVTKKERV